MAHETLQDLPILDQWAVHKAYDRVKDEACIILTGVIYNDKVRGRFFDGMPIYTSRILRIDGCTAQTRKTLYRLGHCAQER